MSEFCTVVDAAFKDAGLIYGTSGLEIWCIENLCVVPVPKSSHGKFYSGSAYVILNTVLLKSGALQHDVHYWVGKDAKEVDSATASDKALELDASLGSHAVEYREVQGNETEKFLSYFKPCIIPIAGVFSSGLGDVKSVTYPISMLTCKGNRVVYVKEVPFSRSSLNHNDVFILDTASTIFLFSGCNSSIQERAKALEVVQYIKETKHSGRCEVSTIEDGKFVDDPDVGEFWSLFGGYAPITRDQPRKIQKQPETPSVNLFWINLQGQLSQIETGSLKKQLLSQDKCYMVDCDSEIYVWMGKRTSVTERKVFISATEDMLNSGGRSIGTHITFLTEGSETSTFRSYFDDWPQSSEENLYEEGRWKVAEIFKQHGYDVKELPEEDCHPSIDCNGTLKVWHVDNKEVFLVQVAEQSKLFSGDCYIVQYTYAGNEKDEHLFYAWLGHNSVEEDRVDAISQMSNMADSIKGRPVIAQIVDNKEPIQFYYIFRTLIVCKGGKSSTYKRFISEKGITDETYNEDVTALFRIQGSSPRSIQAIQVDLVSGSLNSSHCYILQTGSSIFTWSGSLTSPRDHDLLDRMLNLINTTCQPISLREGSEPDVFWNILGGNSEYPKEKEMKSYVDYPHLFTCISTKGNIEVKEIFNFTQDDLTTEDVLVLDCNDEIYVWVGDLANVRSNQQALTIGMMFLQTDILVEGLSLETPIYIIKEGHEPSFFTCFFEWDSSKARMHGNSFERKLAVLKGQVSKMEIRKRSLRRSSGIYSAEATPDHSRSKYVSSSGLGKSVSPTSCVCNSSSEVSNPLRLVSPSPIVRKLFEISSPDHGDASYGASLEIKDDLVEYQTLESSSEFEQTGSIQDENNEVGDIVETFPYERLKVISDDPATGIDVTKREAYLSHREFQEKFGMAKNMFYTLPKWKQNKQKMSLNLF